MNSIDDSDTVLFEDTLKRNKSTSSLAAQHVSFADSNQSDDESTC